MHPVLAVPGVMVGGSQVPNLLEPDAASTLVVSQDVDLVVPVERRDEVAAALERVAHYAPSPVEPSVWLPQQPSLLEVNFIGRDEALRDADQTYVLDDDRLPLLVFGLLGLLREGPPIELPGLRVPLPRPAGLLLEKLLGERSGLKGERDLLVASGLLLVSRQADLDELVEQHRSLDREQQQAVLTNLAVLSLMKPLAAMPEPARSRELVAGLLERLGAAG
jgi:hypothetical protein